MSRATGHHAVRALLLGVLAAGAVQLLTGCGNSPEMVAPTPVESGAGVAEAREAILRHIETEDLSPDEVRDWIDFSERLKSSVKQDMSFWGRLERAIRNPWVAFGFIAQATFMMRFVLQIIASERKKRSYVPVAFWYLSLAGGLMLFIYALQRRDPVFVFGQGLGIVIYARNLVLIYRRKDTLRNKLDERSQRNGAEEGGLAS